MVACICSSFGAVLMSLFSSAVSNAFIVHVPATSVFANALDELPLAVIVAVLLPCVTYKSLPDAEDTFATWKPLQRLLFSPVAMMVSLLLLKLPVGITMSVADVCWCTSTCAMREES